jgi:uncharacterized lipoprotein YehR (DUF1307 family)
VSVLERLALVFLILVAFVVVAACDQPQCKEHEQRIEGTGDIFLCVNGRWKRMDNPHRPPIKA